MKINETKDWTPWLPEYESQYSFINHIDSNACGYFSLSHIIETILYFETGVRVKYSARALAAMAVQFNTSSDYVINHYGLIPQEAWPDPDEFTIQEFYKPLPPEIVALGKKFPYRMNLKWIPEEDVSEALRFSPIWYNCKPAGSPGHYVERQNLTQIFDQYQPAIKPITAYPLLNNFQVTLEEKPIEYEKRNEQFWQINPDGTEQVVTDEGILQKLYFGGLDYKIVQ